MRAAEPWCGRKCCRYEQRGKCDPETCAALIETDQKSRALAAPAPRRGRIRAVASVTTPDRSKNMLVRTELMISSRQTLRRRINA
jgi:hypothetical protein